MTPMQERNVPIAGNQSVIMRTFMLRNGAEPFLSIKEIVMLHYEGWPDFGTPTEASTILDLISLLNNTISRRGDRARNAPVLVHCSAGCGRTGAFITVDALLSQYDASKSGEGDEDDDDVVYTMVSALREQRMSAVQTLRQYVLCYECVLHSQVNRIIGDDTQMSIG